MSFDLGNPELVSCTDDDEFIAKLQQGWSLAQYRALVREHQGEGVQIVETIDEREIIPRLWQALVDSTCDR